MSINRLDGVAAYARALGQQKPAATTGSEFSGMVEDLVGGAAQAMKTAEQASAAQVAGKGDLVDVVTAIGAAELALDTVVAVRDRVVNAYQDIMRMQI